MSFGGQSKTGRFHKNEDSLVKVTTLGEVLVDADHSFSHENRPDSPILSVKEELDLNEVYYTAVFDGHGGSDCATFLSRTLHVRIAKLASSMTFDSFQTLCKSSLIPDAFKSCEDEYQSDYYTSRAGSCAIMTLVHENSFLLAHLGDCRAVLYSGGNVIQLTSDHRTSEEHEAKRINDHGGVIINDRVMGMLSPTRAFGDNDIKRRFPGVVSSEPSILSFTIDEAAVPSEHSFLVIASDGVYDALSNSAVCEIVSRGLGKSNNVEEAAKKLVETAAKLNPDDMTVSIVIWNHKTRTSTSFRASSGLGMTNIQ